VAVRAKPGVELKPDVFPTLLDGTVVVMQNTYARLRSRNARPWFAALMRNASLNGRASVDASACLRRMARRIKQRSMSGKPALLGFLAARSCDLEPLSQETVCCNLQFLCD